jgi:sugar phosphate isomerase/epimerase
MKRKDAMILGINHQFIHLRAMEDAAWHAKTLARLAADDRFDALDCWVWAAEPYRTEEIRLLSDCGRQINYNIGDRRGEAVSCFAACDAAGSRYAWDQFRREAEMALAAGARKLIIGSGPDLPDRRDAALAAFAEFLTRACAWLPSDVSLNLEPTDRDLDKFFLLGPLPEAVRLVMDLRNRGVANLALLLDMGHIPLLHETIGRAVEQVASCLGHVHLGNCIISNRSHPLFGDKHVAWCESDGVYQFQDVVVMLQHLLHIGYLGPDRRATVTFEMRPLTGLDPEDSIVRFISILDLAWEEALSRHLSGGQNPCTQAKT